MAQKYWFDGIAAINLLGDSTQKYWLNGLPGLSVGISSVGPAHITLTFEDAIELTDAILLNIGLTAVFSDTLELVDAVQVDFLVFILNIPLQFLDRLEIGEAELNVVPGGQVDHAFQFSDKFYFQDDINAAEPRTNAPEDSLSLSDAINVRLDSVVEAADTLFYNWGDEARVVLGQEIAVSDSLTLSDAISVQLTIVAIVISVSDSLSLSDVVTVRLVLLKAINDNITLSDAVVVRIDGAIAVADSLSLSDALQVLFTEGRSDIADLLNLSDSVNVSLSAQLNVAVSDSMSFSDSATTRLKGTDLSYLRRYLNDVPR